VKKQSQTGFQADSQMEVNEIVDNDEKVWKTNKQAGRKPETCVKYSTAKQWESRPHRRCGVNASNNALVEN